MYSIEQEKQFLKLAKHFQINETGRNFQYIAFEFCNEYTDLKNEFFSQMEKILKES